jgi:hypothetical protein
VGPLRRLHCVLGLCQHLPCGLLKGPARICELHAPFRALQEHNSQLVFELANLLAERGLRDVQPRRCPAKVEFVRDDQKRAQMAKFHSNFFSHLVTPVLDIGQKHTRAA